MDKNDIFEVRNNGKIIFCQRNEANACIFIPTTSIRSYQVCQYEEDRYTTVYLGKKYTYYITIRTIKDESYNFMSFDTYNEAKNFLENIINQVYSPNECKKNIEEV